MRDEIAAVLDVCGDKTKGSPRRKVILETGEIDGYDQIRAAMMHG